MTPFVNVRFSLCCKKKKKILRHPANMRIQGVDGVNACLEILRLLGAENVVPEGHGPQKKNLSHMKPSGLL